MADLEGTLGEIRRAFAEAEAGEDGKISLDEFRILLGLLGTLTGIEYDSRPEDVAAAFQGMDTGKSGFVSEDELKEWWGQELRDENHCRKIFDAVCGNEDGNLNAADLLRWATLLQVDVTTVDTEAWLEQHEGEVMGFDAFRDGMLAHAAKPSATKKREAAGTRISEKDYEPRALGFFLIESPARLNLLCVITHRYFDAVILACIGANSVMMAMDDPLKDEANPTAFETRMDHLELVFNIIFTLEMTLKIIGLGFVAGPQTYLHSPWNILDFVVVVSAWLPYVLGDSANAGGIRAFRLLRPLRAITRFPGLKRLVTTLFMAIPQLQVLAIMVFMYVFVFAVVATQLWNGLLYQRCHSAKFQATACVAADPFCNNQSGLFVGDGAPFCDPASSGEGLPWEGKTCPQGDVCELHDVNPYWGILSFDSFGDSTIPVMQMATVSSWQEVMHITQDATGGFAVIYFLLGTVLGGYFLLNLVIAVLKSKFEVASAVGDESSSAFGNFDLDGSGELSLNEMRELFHKQGVHLADDVLLDVFAKVDKDGGGTVDLDEFEDWLRSNDVLAAQMREQLNVGKSRATGADKTRMDAEDSIPDDMPLHDFIRYKLRSFNSSDDWLPLFQYYDADRSGDIGLEEFTLILRRDIGLRLDQLTETEIRAVFDDIDAKGSGYVDSEEFSVWVQKDESADAKLARMRHAIKAQSLADLEALVEELSGTEKQQEVFEEEAQLPRANAQESGLLAVVNSVPFYYVVCCSLYLNTAVLVLDHHGISDDNAKILDLVNSGLGAVFVLEMLFKLVALSPEGPLSHFGVFDKFDLFLCVGGLLDRIPINGGGQDSSLYILGVTFRVWRIVRLAWILKTLQPVFHVAVKTISGLVYIISLLLLGMFIFAILGMQLFGGKFNFEDGRPRAHYDSFGVAFQTTFQIVTFDSWQIVMYDGIRSMGTGAYFYFISWVIIGAMLLLNLLLVIILDVYVQVSDTDDQDEEETDAADDEDDQEEMLNPLEPSADPFEIEGAEDMNTRSNVADWGVGAKSLIARDGIVRKTSIRVADSRRTDHVIIVIIVCNCVTMAMDHPDVDPDSETRLLLDLADFIFTVIFTIEMSMRIIAFGLWSEGDGYLRGWWNRLDFSIVVISWIDYIAAAADIGFLKTLRLLRALRALRLFNRLTGLKILIDSLIDSVHALRYIFAIVGIVFVAFAILGVSLFKGKLWRCQDEAGAVDLSSCVGTFVNPSTGVLETSIWANPENNFDNVLHALFTLYTVSTSNDWIITAQLAIDATGVDQQPIPENSQHYFIYFLFFIVTVPWFALNLFIGVIYGKYVDRASAGQEELSKAQKQWLAIIRQLAYAQPSRQLNDLRHGLDPFRQQVFDVVSSKRFDKLIMGSILFNCVIMAGTYHDEPTEWTDIQLGLNSGFTLLFTVEAVMKMLAFGLRVYLTDSWCQFDLFVVIGSWLDLLFTWLGVSLFSSSMFRVIRVTRVIGRIGRLLKILSDSSTTLGLDEIGLCLYQTLPQLAYIGILVGLILFIFGVLAMNLFGHVVQNGCLNPNANFERAPMAVLTLLGVATKDRATCTVHALMVTEPNCAEAEGNCGMPVVAQIFFVIFSLTIMFTTIEMFVNVVLQSFEDLSNAAGLPITLVDIASFSTAWAKFDPLAEGWIDLDQLDELIMSLPPRVGLNPLAADTTYEKGHLRLVEMPGGEFSRHLLGNSIQEVESAGTRKGGVLRIERILRHCYGDEFVLILEGLELGADALHERLAQFGLSREEVEAMVTFLDGGGSDTPKRSSLRRSMKKSPSSDSQNSVASNREAADGRLSGEEFQAGLLDFHAKMYGVPVVATSSSDDDGDDNDNTENVEAEDAEPDTSSQDAPTAETDVAATRKKTQGALLKGLRSGDLEAAVAKMEVDLAVEEDKKGGDAGESHADTFEKDIIERPGQKQSVTESKAETALRKLVAGRLNFLEVLFAVCERKVGKPLPPQNFICREARIKLGMRMPSLCQEVEDYAFA